MGNKQPVPLTSTAYPLDYVAPPDKAAPAVNVILRNHHDGLGDYMSAMTATVNDEPSETQTQFTAECDINNILDRYTRGQLPEQRPVKYGETIDYSVDLQTALDAASSMEIAHSTAVPPELRTLYPTWREWVTAAANGSYEHELATLAEKKKRLEDDAAIIKAHREGKPLDEKPLPPSDQGKDKKPD